MQAIDLKTAQEANYTLYEIDDNIKYFEDYEHIKQLFKQCKSAFARVGECNVPYYWAPVVLEAIRKMLAVDPKLILVDVKEKNSKLQLSFWCPSRDPEVRDIAHQAMNDVDQLVHNRVRKMLAQRKFLYVPRTHHS